jgi:pyruvate kinase
VVRRLCLNWGVTPLLVGAAEAEGDQARIELGLARARALGRVLSGDVVVTTTGVSRTVGTTSVVRVVTVP